MAGPACQKQRGAEWETCSRTTFTYVRDNSTGAVPALHETLT